jgi:hypothetical protein
MRSCHPFGITVAKPHMLTGVRETDIRDSYVPSPMVATNSSWSPHRTRTVPLSTRRLTRRGRD